MHLAIALVLICVLLSIRNSHVVKVISDYEPEDFPSEDSTDEIDHDCINDRKRTFCDHCQDYVDKSTYYRHKTLYITDDSTAKPFNLDSDESDCEPLAAVPKRSTYDVVTTDHYEAGNADQEFQQVHISMCAAIASYVCVCA